MNTFETQHKIIIGAAQKMTAVKNNSVALVVTSPPYPMIEMWDEIMANQNKKIQKAIDQQNGAVTFEMMHQELDKIWAEVARVLMPGGFACINIGDATRTINENFALYASHARIISAFQALNMPNLPNIIWRKQTNAPNKFMGSGMLPAGAYVTLEHEWILIFRKEGKRIFKTDAEKLLRKQSAFFWEERNIWFSDLWDLKGTKQNMSTSNTRARSAAYPFEIPYRLINMYSVYGDTILDPFLGTGTTMQAAIATGRNSIGYEIDEAFLPIIHEQIKDTLIEQINHICNNRLDNHKAFVAAYAERKNKTLEHFNNGLKTPVITRQETDLKLYELQNIKNEKEQQYKATHSLMP